MKIFTRMKDVMYGYLSQMMNNYKIQDTTDKREQFHGRKNSVWKNFVRNYASFPARGTYFILEIVITILALLFLWDCYVVKGWSTWILVFILVLFFIPLIGDVLALSIIIYWLLEVRPNSQLMYKLGMQ